MSLVTIRGHLGSGAPEVGRQVADALHIDYIDREIIAKVAELLDEQSQDIIAKEMPPGSLWERIARAFGFDNVAGSFYAVEPGFLAPYSGAYLPAWQIPLDDTQYLSGLESVINELARDQNVVIRGRGSQFILKNNPAALHVLIIAPLEIRVKRIMDDLKKDKEGAKKEISHSDNSRRAFVKRYFQADMDDPEHYDLVINTAHFNYEQAASIIIKTLVLKDRTEGSRQGSGG